MALGGPHGDSMGIGYFTKVSEKRTSTCNTWSAMHSAPKTSGQEARKPALMSRSKQRGPTGGCRSWALATTAATLR